VLVKALKINRSLVGEENPTNIRLFTLAATAYIIKKDYDKALDYLNTAWELADRKYGKESEPLGAIYIELARVQFLKDNLEEAISN